MKSVPFFRIACTFVFMVITVLAFGITSEILGSREVTLELPTGCSVEDLKETLLENYPDFSVKTSFQVAVNHVMASGAQIISENDEIALIPPVSGG
jgi:molybdopterin converting factor subunit 1